MVRQSRSEEREALRKRLEPLLGTALSNNEVARRANTSATTVARFRKQRGIAVGVVRGGDGKDYVVGGAETRVIHQIKRHLVAVSELMGPERATEEVCRLVEEIRDKAKR